MNFAHDESQVHVPPSFLALYSDARQRLREPIAHVRQRHELCEDLSQHLVAHAQALLHDRGVNEEEVLARCERGLLAPDAGVSADEARWTVRRLAELLDWPDPGPRIDDVQ